MGRLYIRLYLKYVEVKSGASTLKNVISIVYSFFLVFVLSTQRHGIENQRKISDTKWEKSAGSIKMVVALGLHIVWEIPL